MDHVTLQRPTMDIAPPTKPFMAAREPLVTVKARPLGPQCPFGQPVEWQLSPSSCLWLQGDSGRGKTSLAMAVAGLRTHRQLRKIGIGIKVEWNVSIPERQRCGVLFQQTTLVDELTVGGNLAIALHACDETQVDSNKHLEARIKQLLEMVGLDYAKDAGKRPSELSGGMGRRASLAMQLAQRKRIIVLDEPFTGLDHEAAVSVAKELVHLRQTQSTALILISHEPDLAEVVLNGHAVGNQVIALTPPLHPTDPHHYGPPSLFGTTFIDRFRDKLHDYIIYSLPLIVLALAACGLALSMLSADLLSRLDITDRVVALVEQEVQPLIKMLTGEEPSAMTMFGVKLKVRSMLNRTVPGAKASLYAMSLTKLFVMEIGPLLTALLLAGRIGGSYAGKVATMQATAQNKLLSTLGISPVQWSLWPALVAALLAGPLLTVLGTAIALALGSVVGPMYGIGDAAGYWQELQDTLWPPLRLRSLAPLWEENATTTTWWQALWTEADFRATGSDSYMDAVVEVVTYLPMYHFIKSTTFIAIIMSVAEVCARRQSELTPRGVPAVITLSVVGAGLLVIVADWGLSQLWLLRR